MPGLLRGVARTAVVAGTATAVSNRVSRRQANRWGAQEQQQQQQYEQQQYEQQQSAPRYESQPYQPAPAAAPSGADSRIAQLKELAALKAQGVLSDEEFAVEKARILGP
jgi:transcription initiation factor TFIID subunit TAF12